MYITVNYQSGRPIYEQIKSQIRAQIFSGELKKGEPLPSIRMLAKELQIGVITAKRAYDDLCAEGFLYSVPGKGVFAAEVVPSVAENYKRQKLTEQLSAAKEFARANGVSDEELIKLLKSILGE